MQIKRLGSNQRLLLTNHGDEVLYSYEKAVAGFKLGIGWFRTYQKYSHTTSKHINQYLNGRESVIVLSPQQIEELFS